MSTEAPPANAGPSKGGEISLEDLDSLLESEDPGFAKSLDSMRTIESDANVTIESSVIEDPDGTDAALKDAGTEGAPTKPKLGWRGRFFGARERLSHLRPWATARLLGLGRQTLVFMQSRPKELFFYLLSMARVLSRQLIAGVGRFRHRSRAERLGTVGLVILTGLCLWMFARNLRGNWLPRISTPELTRFQPFADSVETYEEKEPRVSFNSAFPQERHDFLFGKMKVNLRRTEEHPLPMGAFELVTLVDSKDTAIEMRDREIEFSDLLQRVFEEESFNDLESEIGKGRVKTRLKRELNQKLTQGWVKEINFKTFILKP